MGARCQFNFATYEWISSCACQLNWLLHQLMWPHHRIGLKKLPQNDSQYAKIHVLVVKLHLNLVLVSWCSADLTSPCHWPFQNLPKSLHLWCIYDLGPHFPLFCAFVTQNKKKILLYAILSALEGQFHDILDISRTVRNHSMTYWKLKLIGGQLFFLQPLLSKPCRSSHF